MQSWMTRFELDADEERADGFLYSEGRGRAGENRPGTLFPQNYGFASRPPKGSIGTKVAMGDRHSMPIILGLEHPDYRPKIAQGDAALYDQRGNIIWLQQNGVTMDFQNRSIEMTAGDWTIKGDVRIEGALHVTSDITTDATNPNKHSH